MGQSLRSRLSEKPDPQEAANRLMAGDHDPGDANQRTEQIALAVLDAAFRVHTELGPGLLEHVYQRCLALELRAEGHEVVAEAPLEVCWRDDTIQGAYRVDLLVDDRLIVELESVEELAPIHVTQTLTHPQLAELELALLVNFNTERLSDGIKRVIRSGDR